MEERYEKGRRFRRDLKAKMVKQSQTLKVMKMVVEEAFQMLVSLAEESPDEFEEMMGKLEGGEVKDAVEWYETKIAPKKKKVNIPEDKERCTAMTKKGDRCTKKKAEKKKLCKTHLRKKENDEKTEKKEKKVKDAEVPEEEEVEEVEEEEEVEEAVEMEMVGEDSEEEEESEED